MFKLLGRFTAAHAWKICAGWLLAGVVLSFLAPSWQAHTQDDDIRFLPDRCDSVRGYRLLERAFPQDVCASRVIFAVERPGGTLTEADLALVDQLVADLNRLRDAEPALQIGRVSSHRDPFIGKRLVSADGECTLIQVALASPYLALQTRKAVDRAEAVLHARMAHAGKDAPRLLVTGPAGVGRDLTRASADSLHTTTLATIVLTLVVLLLVYRAPLLALVPLVTIGVSTWIALDILALLTLIPGVYLVNVSKVFAIVLLYGAGTDYCLFLISRYREELTGGTELHAAISRSVVAVGGSLAASAGTVVCGLGFMGFAEFAKVRCAGPAIALSLAVVLVASLTLTPALLHLLGERVFWPRQPRLRTYRASRVNLWEQISNQVIARPVLIWSVAVALLAPLALLGLCIRPNYKATGELAPSAGSVRGLAAIQRHFTAGEIGPVTVLLSSPTDWNSPQGRDLIAHLSQGFSRLENVAEVRSLTQPLGTPWKESQDQPAAAPPAGDLLGSLLRIVQRPTDAVRDQVGHTVRDTYSGTVPAEATPEGKPRSVARLDVVLRSDPFAPESVATLDLIQTWLRQQLPRSAAPLGGIEAECYGVTVGARDLALVTESDRSRVNLLVLAGVFLILIGLVRRPGMAAYLLATVLFSYFATLGMTALAGTIVGGRPLGVVDWHVPFFLFTILVAVGEDYNILLIMRALRERRRHGADEGMRRALARTGGTITSCGLIMAGTFATLMLAGLGTLVQIGFALAFGVLLDTFVVRPLLVPAFALLVWRKEEQWRGMWKRVVTLPWRPRKAA
jgi:RND superfamily putative drug exporter